MIDDDAPSEDVVTATLPSGQRARVRLHPAPVSAAAVNRLRARIAAADRHQSQRLAAHGRAIGKLKDAQLAAVEALSQRQVKSRAALDKRLLAGDAKLARRVDDQLAKLGTGRNSPRATIRHRLAGATRRAQWNHVLLVAGLPFFAAFGDAGDPFSRDNLALAGSLTGWLVGDDVLDHIVARHGRKMPRALAFERGADLWSYLAPLGHAATAWFLLKDRQHVRFLTGVTPVAYTAGGSFPTMVELEVARGDAKAFAARTDVPVVATIAADSPSGGAVGVAARVVAGNLQLRIRAADQSKGTAQVAWIVDTQSTKA